MVQTTLVRVKAQNRVTIPQSVRIAEDIGENDVIRITVEKISKKGGSYEARADRDN